MTTTSMEHSTHNTSPGAPWLIWLTSAVFVIFQFLIQLSSGVIVKQLMIDFSISGFAAGMLISCYYYIYISLQTPGGILMDRFGPRHLLSYGAFILGMGCVLFGMTHHYFLAILARLAMGGGASFAFVGSLYIIREWFATERYATLVGFAETLGMMGSIFGTISLAAILGHYGWRISLISSGVFSIFISIACWSLIRNHNPAKAGEHTVETATSFLHKLKNVAVDPIAWLNGSYVGMMFCVAIVFAALWAPPFFQLTLNCSLTTASAVVAMLFLGSAIGCPLYGYLSEKLESRRPLMLFGAISSAVLLVIIIYHELHTVAIAGSLMFLLGLCNGSYVLSFAVSNEIAPVNMKNTYTGFTNTVCMLGAPIFQPLLGFLLDYQSDSVIKGNYTFHEYEVALSVLPIIMVIAAILVIFLPETHPKRASFASLVLE